MAVEMPPRSLEGQLPAATVISQAPSRQRKWRTAMRLLAELKACSMTRDGRAAHAFATEIGEDTSNRRLGNTLISVYSRCGSMGDARNVFDRMQEPDAVSWSVLILGYADNGEHSIAIDVFARMPTIPDNRAFVAVLKACGNMSCMTRGMAFHALAAGLGCLSNTYVGNTLIAMYAKCGNMILAERVFDAMRERTVVSWNALIFGYADNGEAKSALEKFKVMKNPKPNSRTFIAALKACGTLAAMEIGLKIHRQVRAAGFDKDVMVATALIDFYGKCGCVGSAQEVFDSMLATKGVVTWTALMGAYGCHGDAATVLELFQEMEKDRRVKPDRVTFLCLLAACCHSGMIDEGQRIFAAMRSRYGLAPGLEHYTCMVDLLGRGNRLDEAVKMAMEMEMKPDIVTWAAILVACSKWGNLVLGRLAFEWCMELCDDEEEYEAFAVVLMESVYSARGMDEEQAGRARFRRFD